MEEARITVPALAGRKARGEKLSMITAYDYTFARIFDAAGIDVLLVGDSLGNVVQGHDTTLPVTLDEMVYHTRLVSRAAGRALVVGDMPFGTYHASAEQAVTSAVRLLKEGGAHAVKLEGGERVADRIAAIARLDIPVMAHVGLKPQSVHKFGGMKVQRDEHRLLADARAAQEAGAFGVLLELIPRDIAAQITRELAVPTIGIGAGPDCDGQVLVSYDMLGLTDGFHPKFVKHFAELRAEATRAAQQYVTEVRSGAFPDDAHSHR